MKHISLRFDNDTVRIVKKNGSNYSITVETVVTPLESGLSKSIMHLLGKTWIELEALYKIAEYANSKKPNNDIDWGSTFYSVEKHFYEKSMSDVIPPPRDIIELIIYKQTSAEDIENELRAITRSRLAEHHLL